jgi:hypothetical protein
MSSEDIARIAALVELHAPTNDGIRDFDYAGELNGRHYWWGGGYKMVGPECVLENLKKWGADPKMVGEISSRLQKNRVLY